MATINDFGGDQPLSAPPLGGPNGWAAAVRDMLNAHSAGLLRQYVHATGILSTAPPTATNVTVPLTTVAAEATSHPFSFASDGIRTSKAVTVVGAARIAYIVAGDSYHYWLPIPALKLLANDYVVVKGWRQDGSNRNIQTVWKNTGTQFTQTGTFPTASVVPTGLHASLYLEVLSTP